MKVLQLVKTSIGASWALEQMIELRRQGMSVSVVLPGEGPLVCRYRDHGIGVHFADLDPMTILKRGVAYRNSLRELVSSVAPDVIHSHFVQTTLSARWLLGRSDGPPRFFQVAGPLHLENSVTRAADLRSSGARDYWVPACELSRQLLFSGGVEAERVRLIYHGLRADRFVPQARGTLRDMLGVDASIPIIGMVAYMYAPKTYLGQSRGLKGHEDLIDAMTLLPPRFANAVLVIVGGPWGDHARAYAERVVRYGKTRLGDRVKFLGTRNDVLELYPDFAAAVHPSHSENLGGAVESMMMEIPTIATRTGGFPDIVIPGRTGWLAGVRKPAELAAAITDALDNPERAKVQAVAAREFVSEKLGISGQASRLIRFYDDVLSGRQAVPKAA